MKKAIGLVLTLGAGSALGWYAYRNATWRARIELWIETGRVKISTWLCKLQSV